MANLSWEFAQQAEAHDAYLVTELGNLFPVERTSPGGNNTGLGALNAGVTQAMLGFMAGITEKETDFEFVTGTDSIGDLHEYATFFQIPPNVASSSSGYVGIYNADDPHTSVPISTFFSTYRYDSATNELRDVGQLESMPFFDSIAVESFGSSKKINGNAYSNGYGFYAYNGAYIVKLHPGFAYTISNNIVCYYGICDAASVITSDSNLLQTTANGMLLANPSTMNVDSKTVSGTKWYKDRWYEDYYYEYTVEVRASVPKNIQISAPANIVGGTFNMDYTSHQTCRDEHAWVNDPDNRYADTIAYDERFSGPYPVTQLVDGKFMLSSIEYKDRFDWAHVIEDRIYSRGVGCWLQAGTTTWSYEYITSERKPDSEGTTVYDRKKTVTASQWGGSTVSSNGIPDVRISIFDKGIPAKDHLAYWSQTNSTFRNTTNTQVNPDYVYISGNDAYMVIENNLGGSIAVEGHNATSAVLRIEDLPPDTVYSIEGTGLGSPIVGVTDSNGEIRIENSNRFNGVHDLKLNVFRDALVFTNLSGMTVIDHFNNAYFNIPSAVRDGVVYTTTKYVDMPIPLDDTEITSVGVGLLNCEDGRLDLPYLAGTYNGGDNLLVPVIPGFDRVCYVINGDTFTLKYADIRQNADVGFGESGGNSNNVNTPISGYSSTTATVSMPLTVLETGQIELGVEGIVRSESDMSYIRMYKGEANMPGETAFDPDPINQRYGRHCDDTMRIPGWQYNRISAIPGWEYGGIANMEPLSDIPDPSSRVSATISVSKNGEVVLTKTVLTDVLTDLNTREINTSVPEIRKYYPHYFSLGLYSQNSIGYWCLPDRDDYNHVELAEGINDGQYMLCSSGVYSYFGAFDRWIRVPVCVTPDRAAECGYEITQRQQRSVFGDTITLDNVEIGDVIEVDITATYRVGLEEFTCNGQSTGNNVKRGTVTVDILNPSVQVQ